MSINTWKDKILINSLFSDANILSLLLFIVGNLLRQFE